MPATLRFSLLFSIGLLLNSGHYFKGTGVPKALYYFYRVFLVFFFISWLVRFGIGVHGDSCELDFGHFGYFAPVTRNVHGRFFESE